MIRTAILGSSGFVGGELLRLLAAHPGMSAVRCFGDSKAGQPLRAVHPHLAQDYSGMSVDRFEAATALDGIDLLFAALPHGVTQKMAGSILDSGVKFVDLGADFRLSDPEDYPRWYGHEHHAPDLLAQFAYGIPEINRDAIRQSRAVAAAGCYPTATILALKPLVDAGLIKAEGIIVDAASGVSGAGREPKESTGFSNVTESFTAYGLLNHRHTAEMDQALGGPVLFTPHLAPMSRGILATCYAEPAGPGDPLEALAEAYRDEPFVHVSETPPATKWTLGSNAVHITARRDERTGRVLVISAIDNLVKGAAGQMIQCANLMFGQNETAGLPRAGVHP